MFSTILFIVYSFLILVSILVKKLKNPRSNQTTGVMPKNQTCQILLIIT